VGIAGVAAFGVNELGAGAGVATESDFVERVWRAGTAAAGAAGVEFRLLTEAAAMTGVARPPPTRASAGECEPRDTLVEQREDDAELSARLDDGVPPDDPSA
jgi:predicted alpha/beta-hydrolase family hydrolase